MIESVFVARRFVIALIEQLFYLPTILYHIYVKNRKTVNNIKMVKVLCITTKEKLLLNNIKYTN